MFNTTDCNTLSTNSFWLGSSESLRSSLGLSFPGQSLEDPLHFNHSFPGSTSAAAASAIAISDPGNGPGQAFNVGTLSSTQVFSQFVGSTDPNDYYRLDLSAPGSLNIALDGLSADANLQLFNSNGIAIASSSQVSNLPEFINASGLAAGTYYVRVYQSIGDTNYTLSLTPTYSSNTSTGSTLLPSGSSQPASPFVTSPASSTLSVVDASGDNTPYTVFQGGALRLSYSVQGLTALSSVRLEALSNGTLVSTLGTWSRASLSNALINLASIPTLTAGSYQFRLVARDASGQDFVTAAQALNILTNTRINGTFAADTLDYTAGLGTGAVILGRGGTDTLNLGAGGISRTNITSINGLNLTAFNGSTLSQAIYGGTAFDYMTLSDGREIYFQGIEYLRFADGTTLELQVHPNDTYFNYQWNLTVSDVPSAWRFTQGSTNILLASLDTGLPVGANGLVNTVDIATNRLTSYYWPWANDDFNDYGHGHSAISIMAGTSNNAAGIAGINWNSYVYVNDIFGGNKVGAWRLTLQSAIQNTLNYARTYNMKVVFQSGFQGDWFTDGGTRAQLEQLIQDNSDIAVFSFLAGNGGPGGNIVDPNYLTSVSGVATLETTHSNVLSVGALQRTGSATVSSMANATAVDIASYSNRGSNLTLVAPTDSLAINKSGNLTTFGGTSAANPNLAGIASLVWSANPALTGGQVRQILTDTAMDLGTTGRDNTFGSGLVNADAAVRRASALQRNADVANLYSTGTIWV
jgi:serine protease